MASAEYQPDTESRSHRLSIELGSGSEPIGGWIERDGARRRFSGWLELLEAIGAAHHAARDGETATGGDRQ